MTDTATTTKTIKGTRTEQNLVSAYLSETQAYARYTYYAKQAYKAGYPPLQKVYLETADNELRHAKVFFKMLEGGKVAVEMDADAGVIGDVESNLKQSIEEETHEGVAFYRAAAAVALEEGFEEIASHFSAIAEVEDHHRARFERYLKRVIDGTVWKRDKPIKWQCLECGFIFEGTEPPETCPGCDHPRQYYTAMDGIND